MTRIKCLTSLRFFPAAMIVVFHSVNAFQPVHFATFLFLLWLTPTAGWVWKGEHPWQIGVSNLLLVHGWIPSASYYFSFNSVSWSTSTQTFFYLAFPFLICQFQRSWWWKLFCIIILVTVEVGLTDFLQVPPYGPANFSAITSHGLVYINPLVRILEFVCGMVAAVFFLRGRKLRIVTSIPVWLWTGFELFALTSTLLIGTYGPWLFLSLFHGHAPDALALYAACAGSFPIFALLIGVLSFERGILSRLLSVKWLVALGEISFAIYLSRSSSSPPMVCAA
jgi:peptidoglycan/LPS O-acetylase OafA/YrhL